ncbi:MAG: RluA family pseudouridine synthase [Planctomycetota bacterium]|jgi:23S rRNA pseudouridine1911/1915/1917 synthase
MTSDEPRSSHRFTAERAEDGVRLDRALVARFPGYSRSRLAKAVKAGYALVNGKETRPGRTLAIGDDVEILLETPTRSYAMPEKIDLDILHEDERLIVLNKPPGLTVHPGSGERRGTMANALAYHFGQLSTLQGPLRPGIVHRLDRDTSGVILVAKDDEAHQFLAAQFKQRTIHKTYLAVVQGVMEFDADLISFPLGKDVRRPQRMAVRHDVGKPSESYYEVQERFKRHTFVEVHPRTGRTHQIRVHLMTLGHPIVSDRVYGRADRILQPIMRRQALHAHRLDFTHPSTGESMVVECPLPEDMQRLVDFLRSGGAENTETLAEEMGVADGTDEEEILAEEESDEVKPASGDR